MLVDYARDDFNLHDAFTYDLILDGIDNFGDIHFLKIAKEGTDGWCLQRLQFMVNERTVFLSNVAPSCRWHDRAPRDSMLFTYDVLRGGQQWQSYVANVPSQITERALESIVEAIVGNVLVDQNAYWDAGSGGGVSASYGSPRSVHYDIQFRGHAPGPDPTIKLDFDLSVNCFCGDVSLEVSDIDPQVSSQWYPGWLKDYIAEEIGRRLGKLTGQFAQTFSLGIPLCPIITVLAPPPNLRIRFDPPDVSQDLAIQSTVLPSMSSPGRAVALTSTVANLGNGNSNSFSTDVYLATATGQAPAVADMVAMGVRLGGTANVPAINACGAPTTWTQTLQLPTGLACSARESSPGYPIPRIPSRSDRLQPADASPRYWLVTSLTSVGEPAGPNASVVPLQIGLPDVNLNLRSPSAMVVGGRRLVINGGRIENTGAFATDSLVYRVFLTPATGASARVVLHEGRLAPLAAGAQVTWPGGLALAIELFIPPGRYTATFEVQQRGGGAECDLANNSQSSIVEVN